MESKLNRLIGLLLFAVVGATIANEPSPAANLEVQKAVDAGSARYIAAYAASDARAFADVYDVNGARLGDDGNGSVTRGRDAIAHSAERFMKAVSGTVQVTAETQRLYTVDDLAYEEGKYTLTFTLKSEGSATHVAGQYVTIWKRQADGGWKIYADIPVPVS